MTRKNPYENQDETLDIPDFFDEKTQETSDSGTVDMSIFKMSDEELYDDLEKQDDDLEELSSTRSTRKLNTTALLGLIVMLLLLATCVGCLLYAVNQHRAYVKANTNYNQVLANQDAYKQQIAEKDAMIESLNKQIEELKNNNSHSAGVYEIIDGPITFRSSAERPKEGEEDNFTTYNGYDAAEDGEKFNVIEIVNSSDGYIWAKVADDVYFCLGTSDEVWAQKVE